MSKLVSCEELALADVAQQARWDALWRGEAIGRPAALVYPTSATCAQIRETCVFELDEDGIKPPRFTESWRQCLLDDLYYLAASRSMPGDYCPAITIPRVPHGQSQGFADLFGARVERQPDDNFFVYPLPAEPAFIDEIVARPLESSLYWTAVEWITYARAATRGTLPFRNPVMTGPLDTANYLLGTTILLEWVYTEPATLHRLLAKLTEAITRMLRAIKEAAGGIAHNIHANCARGGFGLCSELRALVSAEIYEEFEAPYLKQIGAALGPYAMHSCGSWERTIPSAHTDPNLRVMNGPIKENDLRTLCELADGKLLLSVYASCDVHEEYLWASREAYIRHVLTVTPPTQALELVLTEDDLPAWERVYGEVYGSTAW